MGADAATHHADVRRLLEILARLSSSQAWTRTADRKPDCYGQDGFEILLRDGSILKNSILQSDDDWWWNGAGEKFIDENCVEGYRPLPHPPTPASESK